LLARIKNVSLVLGAIFLAQALCFTIALFVYAYQGRSVEVLIPLDIFFVGLSCTFFSAYDGLKKNKEGIRKLFIIMLITTIVTTAITALISISVM